MDDRTTNFSTPFGVEANALHFFGPHRFRHAGFWKSSVPPARLERELCCQLVPAAGSDPTTSTARLVSLCSWQSRHFVREGHGQAGR
jgi:hypothetical protein